MATATGCMLHIPFYHGYNLTTIGIHWSKDDSINRMVGTAQVIANFGTVMRSVLDGFPIVLLWFFISPLASRIPLVPWKRQVQWDKRVS